MAKLVFFLVALLFLFSFSHARTPSDLPEEETNGRDPASTKLPESEPKPATTILLPSEKPDSEPAKLFEWVPEVEKLPDSDGPTILANEESTEFTHSESVPLTVISFHPVNRHFPRRPLPLSFRHGHRCRHGRRHVGPWSLRFHGGERDRDRDVVPYGDDMILGDDLAFDPVFRGGPRQIPPRWGSFRHGGPRFPFRHEDDMELERPHHHRHHHEDDGRQEFEGMEKPIEHRHEHEREHEGGLLRRFRKFLKHF